MNNQTSSNYLEMDKIKLMKHSNKIEMYLRGEIPVPITLEIQPTEKCNCNCPHCQSRTYFPENERREKIKRGIDLDLKLLDAILINPPDNVIISGTTGEPLLHPHIYDLLTLLNNQNIPVTLITNGLCIDDVLAKKIVDSCITVRISLDAINAESYAQSHGIGKVCWVKVLDNIRMLVSEKKKTKSKCKIGIGYLTNSESENIYKAVLLAKDLEVDFIDFRPFQQDREHSIDTTVLKAIYDNKKWETSEFRINSSHQKYHTVNAIQRTYNYCYCSYFYTLLDPKGDLYLCCNRIGDKSAKYGSIKDVTDWSVCLNSKIKKNMASNVKDCLLGCRLHTYNIVLDQFINKVDYSGIVKAEFTLCNGKDTTWETI